MKIALRFLALFMGIAMICPRAGAEQAVALELGGNREALTGAKYYLHNAVIVSSTHRSGNVYGEWLMGNLVGTMEPAGVIAAGLGYWADMGAWFVRASFGVAIVTRTGWKLSTHNQFTESLSVGNGPWYISYRHFSNGGYKIGNPGHNNGEDVITLGYLFHL